MGERDPEQAFEADQRHRSTGISVWVLMMARHLIA